MTNASEPTTNAKCWCCNGTVFKSANDGIASHYICQSCNSMNVIGGGGGAGAPTTECNIEKCVECCLKRDGDCNGHVEPTTGEIVRALGNPETLDQESLYYWSKVAADRLESQERENASLRAENKGLHKEIIRRGIEIKAMTARAEQAERERDAAFDLLQDMRGCDECKHLARTWREEPCNRCCMEYSFFEPCEQPQEGEGV